MSNALSASQLPTLIARAEQAGGSWVVVVMASLPNCAWCDLVLRDQLIPRMRSTQSPQVGVAILDITDRRPIRIESRSGDRPPEARWLLESPLEWARQHNIRMAPTVFPISSSGKPIGEPLVGYSSADFYGAYLEDRISLAQRHWGANRPTGATT